jgi:hypothetical protein
MKTSSLWVLASVAAVGIAAVVVGIARRPDSAIPNKPSVASLPVPDQAPRAQVALRESRDSRALREQRLLEIERALVSSDPRQRETAFNISLPELLDSEPAWVTELVARQQGETRDALRDEVVRLWIRKDRDAALMWMGTFESEAERKAAATIAMRTLAAIEPAQAIAVADQFGIGRDDGSLEHIVQIWAAENFEECAKWLDMQPNNAWTAQLRTRITQ